MTEMGRAKVGKVSGIYNALGLETYFKKLSLEWLFCIPSKNKQLKKWKIFIWTGHNYKLLRLRIASLWWNSQVTVPKSSAFQSRCETSSL